MIKNLQKHGNSQALVFDKTMLEALGIDGDTPLHITITGDSLVVRPAFVGASTDDIAESLAKMRPSYSGMLKKLAN
jgi:antitoxin component of MazEF toxin-antitoxin module